MEEKNGVFTLALMALLGGLALAGLGGIGLLQGMTTNSLAPWAATALGVGAVSFLIGLALLGSSHSDEPPRFCKRCGEIVGRTAESCQKCGRALV